MSSSSNYDSSDILWGVRAIGREANVVNAHGEVNERVTEYRLNAGLIPGWKRGRRWQSARSIIRKHLTGESAA